LQEPHETIISSLWQTGAPPPREPSVRSTTVLEIPAAEQEALLRELRQARYGHLLAIHNLLLCDAGKNPTEIADFLFCSRSSVYRSIKVYRASK
jgi:hypothetical protein